MLDAKVLSRLTQSEETRQSLVNHAPQSGFLTRINGLVYLEHDVTDPRPEMARFRFGQDEAFPHIKSGRFFCVARNAAVQDIRDGPLSAGSHFEAEEVDEELQRPLPKFYGFAQHRQVQTGHEGIRSV